MCKTARDRGAIISKPPEFSTRCRPGLTPGWPRSAWKNLSGPVSELHVKGHLAEKLGQSCTADWTLADVVLGRWGSQTDGWRGVVVRGGCLLSIRRRSYKTFSHLKGETLGIFVLGGFQVCFGDFLAVLLLP